MNPLVFHIASGESFFSGVALLLLAVGLSWCQRRIWKRLAGLCFAIGLIAVAISATPLPYWLLGIAIVTTLTWLLCNWLDKWRGWIAGIFVFVWCSAVVWEATYWITPTVHPVDERVVTIVGDSVTAGLGLPEEVTWPTIFSQQNNVRVQDMSGSGFTVAQALSRVKTEGINSPLVFVEIGGNDLLSFRSASSFHDDLDALLTLLTQDGRQVVMFELPLLPLHGDYGRAQRSLSRKHGVRLIPKRIFLGILAPKQATRDTIHLTPAGHQAMADEVGRILSPAFDADQR